MNEKLAEIIKEAGERLLDEVEKEGMGPKELLEGSLSLAVSMWHHVTDLTDLQVMEIYRDPINFCLTAIEEGEVKEISEHPKPTLLH